MNAKIQKAVKKLETNEFMWFEYGDDYTASVSAERYTLPDGEPAYTISYHKGEMPAFNGETFATIEELAEVALKLQPDLRKWRLPEAG